MKKKLLLSIAIITSLSIGCISYAANYEDDAKYLSTLGILEGSANGFELEREPTRLEGLIMFLRLIGSESYCLEITENTTPFTDVPQWAYGYVTYAYENGYTQGISDTEFGSNDFLNSKSYGTFVLRALGYDDSLGDFQWATALETLRDQSIISDDDYNILVKEVFLRDHVAMVSRKALSAKFKDEPFTLIEFLEALGDKEDTTPVVDVNAHDRMEAENSIHTAEIESNTDGRKALSYFQNPDDYAIFRNCPSAQQVIFNYASTCLITDVDLYIDNERKTSLNFPATGGYQNYNTIAFDVEIPKGASIKIVLSKEGAINLDYIEFIGSSSLARNSNTITDNGPELVKANRFLTYMKSFKSNNSESYIEFEMDHTFLKVFSASGQNPSGEDTWKLAPYDFTAFEPEAVRLYIYKDNKTVYKKSCLLDDAGTTTFVLDSVLVDDGQYTATIYISETGYHYTSFINKILINKYNGEYYFKFVSSYNLTKDSPFKKYNPGSVSYLDIGFAEYKGTDITNLAKSIVDVGDSDYEKAWKLYQWVTSNIYYNSSPEYKGNTNDAQSVLENKVATCGGFTHLYASLAKSLDIPVKVIIGSSIGSNTLWNTKQIGYDKHAWNEVWVGDRWVLLDCTWGTQNKYTGAFKNSTRNTFWFDVTPEALALTHRREHVK